MSEDYEKDSVIEELMQDNQAKQNKINQLSSGLSAYDQSTPSSNLIQYQVDCSDLLERLEHFYRGEVLKKTDNGDIEWVQYEDEDQIPLNDFGVSSYMEIVSKYIDKNTILSAYNEERIYEILADLGDELVLFTLCNYEKMGMDNYIKKTKFRLLIITTLHIIESTYRRSINAKTFEDVNQSRIIIPSDMRIGNTSQIPQQRKKEPFSLFKKWL